MITSTYEIYKLEKEDDSVRIHASIRGCISTVNALVGWPGTGSFPGQLSFAVKGEMINDFKLGGKLKLTLEFEK